MACRLDTSIPLYTTVCRDPESPGVTLRREHHSVSRLRGEHIRQSLDERLAEYHVPLPSGTCPGI